ncbi:unnamed protein product [Trichobilharzia szidati]|nr:unnamed protein product [Trichobilharzia szidati]
MTIWTILWSSFNLTNFITSLLCLIIIYLLYTRISYRLPPGPIGWPIFGYTACLGRDAFRKIQYLNQIYGDILSFRVLGKTIIILNSYDMIHEAAVTHRSKIGRYTMTVNDILAENAGISNYDTQRAMDIRRAFLRHLHDASKPSDSQNGDKSRPVVSQSYINSEVDGLLKQLRIKQGKPVDVLQLMRRTVWRIIWNFLFETKCQLSDKQIDIILEDIALNNTENQLFRIQQLLPKFWVKLLKKVPVARNLFEIDDIISRHKSTRQIIDNNTGELSNTDSLFGRLINSSSLNLTKNEISRLSYELMAAGTDTTSLTLTWACDYLSRTPTNDPLKLDSSIFNMVHRWASVVPLALPHLVRESFEINGYHIPKSSILIYNLYAVHNEQLKKLGNNEVSSNDQVKESDMPIPFSLGSRSCPGYPVANQLVEHILTAINQEFMIQHAVRSHFETISPVNQQSLTPFGLTRVPHKSMYIFVTRVNDSRRPSI